jgi:hypothetical protein
MDKLSLSTVRDSATLFLEDRYVEFITEVIPNTGLFKLYYYSGECYIKVFGAGYFTHCTVVALISTSHCCWSIQLTMCIQNVPHFKTKVTKRGPY